MFDLFALSERVDLVQDELAGRERVAHDVQVLVVAALRVRRVPHEVRLRVGDVSPRAVLRSYWCRRTNHSSKEEDPWYNYIDKTTNQGLESGFCCWTAGQRLA